MIHQFAMAYTSISSLHARRKYLNIIFFRKILNNPNNPLFNLIPPSSDAAIIRQLWSAHLLPVLRTCTNRYRSFIHHGLIDYRKTGRQIMVKTLALWPPSTCVIMTFIYRINYNTSVPSSPFVFFLAVFPFEAVCNSAGDESKKQITSVSTSALFSECSYIINHMTFTITCQTISRVERKPKPYTQRGTALSAWQIEEQVTNCQLLKPVHKLKHDRHKFSHKFQTTLF